MNKQAKLKALADSYGMDVMDMLEEATFDSVAAGICRNCDYTTDVEPDQAQGWCECCDTPTVVSCLVLADIL